MKARYHIALACLSVCCVSAGAASGSVAAPCQPRDLGFDRPQAGWVHQPLSKLKRDTVYTLAKEEGRTVLRGAADRSASAYVAFLKPPARARGPDLALEDRCAGPGRRQPRQGA